MFFSGGLFNTEYFIIRRRRVTYLQQMYSRFRLTTEMVLVTVVCTHFNVCLTGFFFSWMLLFTKGAQGCLCVMRFSSGVMRLFSFPLSLVRSIGLEGFSISLVQCMNFIFQVHRFDLGCGLLSCSANVNAHL